MKSISCAPRWTTLVFLTSTAPSSLEVYRGNEYYSTADEYVFALADALRVEYEAIVNAGFHVQIDDAWLVALWDRIGIEMGLNEFKKFCMVRVEALNPALRNIPEEPVRYGNVWPCRGEGHHARRRYASNDLIEHPELVSERIQRFARLVGPQNVIASCDCGFGGRTHPQIAWAKLRALCEGAALAGRALSR